MKLEFHPEAEQEFLDAVLRYEAEVPDLGGRFDAEVRAATAVLLQYPDMGTPIETDLRKLVLERFPYSLIYSRTPDIISSSRSRTTDVRRATGSYEPNAVCVWSANWKSLHLPRDEIGERGRGPLIGNAIIRIHHTIPFFNSASPRHRRSRFSSSKSITLSS